MDINLSGTQMKSSRETSAKDSNQEARLAPLFSDSATAIRVRYTQSLTNLKKEKKTIKTNFLGEVLKWSSGQVLKWSTLWNIFNTTKNYDYESA